MPEARVTRLRLPHPYLLLVVCVAIAAAFTWILPAGEYDRRDDPATGRRVVVAGTYHAVEARPVGAFGVAVAVPRGFIAGADVIISILLIGGAWVVVDRMGTLSRAVGALVRRLRRRGLLAIPLMTLLFASMGAIENMQEEIIPMIPVLLLLGRRLGVDAVTVVAMSAGAAIVGSAFGPTNPFQAGIAMKLAELPPLAGGGLRLAMFAVGVALWSLWTLRHARRNRVAVVVDAEVDQAPFTGRDGVIMTLVLLPFAAYVYGALALGWGFNELSGAFFVGAIAAGLVGGLRLDGTIKSYIEGMQLLLPAAMLVGVARSISLVLADGRVIDTILNALATPLSGVSSATAAILMVPLHTIIHVPVSSVSGQAALTMPVLVPLSDLIGLSRQITVLAYQTGAGLCDMITPTNGALLAVLLAADVPLPRWLRFAAGGWVIMTAVGIAGILVALAVGL